MHPRYYFFLLFAIPFLQHCRKDDPDFFTNKEDLVPLYFFSDTSTCTAKKEVPGLGSINWTSNIIASQWKEKLFFTFITFESAENPYIRERVSFSNIPPQKGVHELESVAMQPSCSYSHWLGDGDLLNAGWKLDTTKKNQMEVILLDTVARMVKGKFDVYFIMEQQGISGYEHSERINFKKGYFETRYN